MLSPLEVLLKNYRLKLSLSNRFTIPLAAAQLAPLLPFSAFKIFLVKLTHDLVDRFSKRPSLMDDSQDYLRSDKIRKWLYRQRELCKWRTLRSVTPYLVSMSYSASLVLLRPFVLNSQSDWRSPLKATPPHTDFAFNRTKSPLFETRE